MSSSELEKKVETLENTVFTQKLIIDELEKIVMELKQKFELWTTPVITTPYPWPNTVPNMPSVTYPPVAPPPQINKCYDPWSTKTFPDHTWPTHSDTSGAFRCVYCNEMLATNTIQPLYSTSSS